MSDPVLIAIVGALQAVGIAWLGRRVKRVERNVDGHLSRLTRTNVALNVENSRLNSETPTEQQTPSAPLPSGPPLALEPDGVAVVIERRKE